MNEEQVVLYDGMNPIGTIKFVDNLRTKGLLLYSSVVGLWQIENGDFYICEEDAAGRKRAKLISEPEARYHAVKNIEVFNRFFGELPQLKCA
jgi:hypothetical protein